MYKITKDKDGLSLLDIQLTWVGGMKCKGWKTMRGFIQMIKRQNKILEKHPGTKVKFEVVLPIPE